MQKAQTWILTYKSSFTLRHRAFYINEAVLVLELVAYEQCWSDTTEEVDTYCWSSLEGRTCHWDAPVLAWPPWDKPYQRCSSAQPLPPRDARPVARCCSPGCDDWSRKERGGKKNPCINTWTPRVFAALWQHQSSHHTSQHNNES